MEVIKDLEESIKDLEQLENRINNIVFYRFFYEAIKELPEKDFTACVKALFEYSFNGVTENWDGVVHAFMTLAKVHIDVNANKKQRKSATSVCYPYY